MNQFYLIANYDIVKNDYVYLSRVELVENAKDKQVYVGDHFSRRVVWTTMPEDAFRITSDAAADQLLKMIDAKRDYQIQLWRETLSRVCEEGA